MAILISLLTLIERLPVAGSAEAVTVTVVARPSIVLLLIDIFPVTEIANVAPVPLIVLTALIAKSPPVTVTVLAWVIELALSDIPPVAIIVASSGRRTVVVLPTMELPVIEILTAETDVTILMVLLFDIKI